MTNKDAFWNNKGKILTFHHNIKLEAVRLRLEFERIKQMTSQEEDDYQTFAKLGLEMWNFLNKQLGETINESERKQIIKEMNEIRNAIEEVNKSRLGLEDTIHSVFK